jgi:magnesium transporter
MTETDRGPGRDGDESNPLDDRLFAEVRAALETGDAARLRALLGPLHAADIADLLEQVEGGLRREIVLLAPDVVDGDVLSDLDESLREEVIEALPPGQLAEAVRDLDSDDVVDLIEDLGAPQQEAVLDALADVDRAAVEAAMTYPENSAGRLMQREVVMAPEHWTVGEAIDHLRATEDLPEQFYHVVLVDPRMRPVGQVPLGRLMAARRPVRLRDIAAEDFRTIPATEDAGDVAHAFNKYHLISVPVVDRAGRLVGAITIDDAMIVLDDEHEEDIMRLAGMGEGSLSDPVLATSGKRIPWLGVNLVAAFVAALVISQFEEAIAEVVALAVLMPIVASMGGNAGTQSLTVAVRALATRDLRSTNAWRVVRREALVGLLNGVVFAAATGLVAALWFGSAALGGVMALAMVLTLCVAAVGGVLVPLALDRAGADPAIASGPFVTTITDVVGFFVFLGIASAVLL